MMRSLSLVVSILLILAAAASAHAFLDHAEPAVGSTIDVRPDEIQLWFTEKLEPAFSQIQLFDERGAPVTRNKAIVDSSNPALLKLAVPRLAPGTYKVSWKVMSVDTHVTTGTFTFTVRS